MIFKWHIAHEHVLFISAHLEWERMWWQARIWSSMHTLLSIENNDNVIKLHILWKKLDYFLDNAFLMKCKKYWFKEEKWYYFFPPIVLHSSCFLKRCKLGFMLHFASDLEFLSINIWFCYVKVKVIIFSCLLCVFSRINKIVKDTHVFLFTCNFNTFWQLVAENDFGQKNWLCLNLVHYIQTKEWLFVVMHVGR